METTREKKSVRATGTLTPHLTRLLFLAYHWRYLTARIVRCCFPDEYPGATDRTVRHHLRTLEQADLLKTVRPTQNDPLVYSVTTAARRHLAETYPQYRFLDTREETIRPDRLDHELAVSDFQTRLFTAITRRPDIKIVAFERRYFHTSNRLPFTDRDGLTSRLEPDLGCLLLIQKPTHRYLLLHLIEVDMGTESPAAFRRKLQAYADWHQDTGRRYIGDLYAQHGLPDPHPHFRIHIVTRSRRTGGTDFDQLVRLYAACLTLPPVLRRSTFLTTNDQLKSHPPLAQPIWYPARGFRHAWLVDIQDELTTRPTRHYDFIAAKLRAMPLWPTLPTPRNP